MRPDAVTLLFKEAFDIFPPFEGKPTDDDLLSIREALLPILMVIPFDAIGGIHSLTALLMDESKYAAAHRGKTFVHLVHLPLLYDELIPGDAPTVVHIRAEAAHKSKLEDYNNYEAAECGCAEFLRDVVDEVWYNDLKDAKTFYMQVTALKIVTFLDLDFTKSFDIYTDASTKQLGSVIAKPMAYFEVDE